MTTFVLVHGAWHGGWCWRFVKQTLENAGHTVFAPTLTGLGERSHLLTPEIDLETHIADVLNVLEWEELDDVVLVGHSYGGMVITGVADRAKERLRHLVYLDAFLPADGDSSASLVVRLFDPGAGTAQVEAEIARRRSSADALGGVPADTERLFDIPKRPARLHDWVKRLVTPHPVMTQTVPIRLSNGGCEGLRKTFVLCSGSPGRTPFKIIAERLRADPGWNVVDIDTGHDAMVTMPDGTAALLMNAAAR